MTMEEKIGIKMEDIITVVTPDKRMQGMPRNKPLKGKVTDITWHRFRGEGGGFYEGYLEVIVTVKDSLLPTKPKKEGKQIMTMEEKINQILGHYYLEELTHHETINALVALISDSNQRAVIEERLRILKELNFEVVQPAKTCEQMAHNLFEWTKVNNKDSLKGDADAEEKPKVKIVNNRTEEIVDEFEWEDK
jgi:hypothetical protein